MLSTYTYETKIPPPRLCGHVPGDPYNLPVDVMGHLRGVFRRQGVAVSGDSPLSNLWGCLPTPHAGHGEMAQNRRLAMILVGGAFSIFMLSIAYGRGYLTWQVALSYFPVTGLSVLIGVLFIIEGNQRRKRKAQGWDPPQGWLRRNLQYILVIGIPLIVAIGTTIYWAPLILTRVDDGNRDARLIEGNSITLVWAPRGPGWNWKQPWGGYPSWDALALYGVPPVGFKDTPSYENQHATQNEMEKTGLCR